MLANDMARCEGEKSTPDERYLWVCYRRETCARYVERDTGGPRTMQYAYLCDEDDMYIPAEKPNEN